MAKASGGTKVSSPSKQGGPKIISDPNSPSYTIDGVQYTKGNLYSDSVTESITNDYKSILKESGLKLKVSTEVVRDSEAQKKGLIGKSWDDEFFDRPVLKDVRVIDAEHGVHERISIEKKGDYYKMYTQVFFDTGGKKWTDNLKSSIVERWEVVSKLKDMAKKPKSKYKFDKVDDFS